MPAPRPRNAGRRFYDQFAVRVRQYPARQRLPLGRVSLTGQEAGSWRGTSDFLRDDGGNDCLREQDISITTNGSLVSQYDLLSTLRQHKFVCPQTGAILIEIILHNITLLNNTWIVLIIALLHNVIELLCETYTYSIILLYKNYKFFIQKLQSDIL